MVDRVIASLFHLPLFSRSTQTGIPVLSDLLMLVLIVLPVLVPATFARVI
jgi:hypothetical protein